MSEELKLNTGAAPRFGEGIVVLGRLRRIWREPDLKVWATERFPEPLNGLIIGERTLSDGTCYYGFEETQYRPTQHFRAFLVVTDMRSKPFYALSKQVRV